MAPPTGAWIGDAYYIALPTELMSSGYPIVVRLLRVAADGTMSRVADILKDEFSGAPGFAAGAPDMRLIYGGVPPGQPNNLAVMSRRIGSKGELLSNPTTLGLFPTYFGRAPAVAFGDDTVVLLSGFEQELLTIARVDVNGKIVTRQDIAVSPGVPADDVRRRSPRARRGRRLDEVRRPADARARHAVARSHGRAQKRCAAVSIRPGFVRRLVRGRDRNP